MIQDPILEEALKSCIDYFCMGGVSQSTRFKLIKAVLASTADEQARFLFENKMRAARGLPKWKLAKYRDGISQVFHRCHHISLKGGNPGPKLIEIRTLIESSKLFEHFHPTDDYWASRRGDNKHKWTSIDPAMIEEIEEPKP